ncbi:MAG: hypothetical protein AAGH89_06415 [Verrucomicrobiota bacterium]
MRTQFDQLASGLSEADAAELEQFINRLSAKGDQSVSELSRKISGKTRATSASRSSGSAKVELALKGFRELEAEVSHWETPDYDLVRSKVSSIGESLTKSELCAVSEVLLGKRNTSLTKSKMISQLCYSPIRQLELRFMNVKA